MVLKTEQYSIDVLHVEVPAAIDSETFCCFMAGVLAGDGIPRLKDGFTASPDDVANAICDPEIDPQIKEFLEAVQAHVEWLGGSFVPDEYFFHRWS